MRTAHPLSEGGSVSAFVAVVAAALVMVAGMAYDGGQVLAAHATARDLAANAARAGAQEIDLDTLRATGRAEVERARAIDAVEAYLSTVGAEAESVVEVDGSSVTVSVVLHQPMAILPLPERTVAATETATAVTGR